MLKISSFVASLSLLLVFSVARAQDHSVEVIDAAPEADEVSDELAKLLSDKGIRVKRGSTRTACEIWLCKEWKIDADFEANEERLYPFEPGQLIGLLHFSRRGSDFRDQQVSSGWYTLRFGLQPIDGNHEGTSPTRDFLLLVDAEQDDPEEFWGTDELNEASSEAAGTSHPAMLCLRRATEGGKLTIRHDERTDWWTLHAVGKGVSGDKARDVPVDLVVVGHAEE
jgi:hypothetical protein